MVGNINSIRELDVPFQKARDAFEKFAVPKIVTKYPELDAEKLKAISIDFFDIFADLNQVKIWNMDAKVSGPAEQENNFGRMFDTIKQWQYYAAFFYYKLTSDSDLACTYSPKKFKGLKLKMTCSKNETMGLDHDTATKVLGTIIGEGMNFIEFYFPKPIFTNNMIPELNRDRSGVLTIVAAPQSSHAQLAAASPSAQGHAQAPLALA